MKRKGFTLIELLITTTIIGLLASLGSVSYSYVRLKARDAKRVADIRSVRNAIETYFEQHGKYPDAPTNGIILGTDNAKVISDAGITAVGGESGIVYLVNTPSNVLPGGIPYLYRGRSNENFACTRSCPKYEVTFELESDIGDFLAGPHKLTDDGIKGPEGNFDDIEPPSFLASYIPSGQDVTAVLGNAAEVAEVARSRVADNEEVQVATKAVVAPVAALAVVTNFIAVFATVAPLASFGNIILILFSQPFLFLNKRQRESWGTVYDAGTKVPVDLASVRLIDATSGRAVATKVTDKNGRYAFTPRRGSYRLDVVKPGYAFPAASMQGIADDGHYVGIYHGTLVQVEADGQPVTLNIPVEPEQAGAEGVKKLLSIENKKQLRRFLAKSGPVLGAIALIISPSVLMLLLFLVHLFVYFGFKRLATPVLPKSQGVVYDQETKDPVSRAIVRIFSSKYHKVLETKVTDSHGRYSFHVGHGMYYITVTKPGYQKTQTDEIDFSAIKKPTFIASDLPVKRLKAEA